VQRFVFVANWGGGNILPWDSLFQGSWKVPTFLQKSKFCLSSFGKFLAQKKLNILNRIIFLLLLSKSQFCHHIMKIHHQKKKNDAKGPKLPFHFLNCNGLWSLYIHIYIYILMHHHDPIYFYITNLRLLFIDVILAFYKKLIQIP